MWKKKLFSIFKSFLPRFKQILVLKCLLSPPRFVKLTLHKLHMGSEKKYIVNLKRLISISNVRVLGLMFKSYIKDIHGFDNPGIPKAMESIRSVDKLNA